MKEQWNQVVCIWVWMRDENFSSQAPPSSSERAGGVTVSVQQTCYRAACDPRKGNYRTDVPFISQNVVTARLYKIKQYFSKISCAKIVNHGCWLMQMSVGPGAPAPRRFSLLGWNRTSVNGSCKVTIPISNHISWWRLQVECDCADLRATNWKTLAAALAKLEQRECRCRKDEAGLSQRVRLTRKVPCCSSALVKPFGFSRSLSSSFCEWG